MTWNETTDAVHVSEVYELLQRSSALMARAVVNEQSYALRALLELVHEAAGRAYVAARKDTV